MTGRIRAIFVLLIFSALAMSAGNIRLSVDVGRGQKNIGVGDLFYINIDVSNIGEEPSTPSSAPGAKVMYFDRVSQSSSFSSINGQVTQTSSSRYVLTLKATEEGKFTFGPISIGGDKSNTVSYTIGKGSSNSSSSGYDDDSSSDNSSGSSQTNSSGQPKFIGKGDSNLFLRASVTQTNVYEQQALVYTVKLYSTYDAIKFIGATDSPKFDGFVVEESKDVSHSLSVETFNGKTYGTAVIARYVIFPQMTGQLKVTGNTYTVSVDQREYYHDPFWGNMSYATPLQLNVTPNDLVVNVKPLPSPKPADFSGGVGRFSISSELKSSVFKTNTAASIVYTVSGSGNLKYIQLPDLNAVFPSELEVYTPTTDVQANVNGGNVSGKVTFDYSFMPLEEGVFKIPPVKLVYFNPETGQYETAVAKGYDVTVGKGQASSKSQANRPRHLDSKLMAVNPKDLKSEAVPMVTRFPFWLFFIIPFMVLVISVALNKRYIKTHADMASFNSRRADKLAKRRLKKAAACMRKNDSEGFYHELLVALWGYMGDKLKMPGSELMRENIKSVLEEKNVETPVIDGFISLLDTCEFAKYSPAGGQSGMEKAYQDAVKEINDVENAFKKGGK
ncbi:MAG: BatD family protein [Muribaculaceae bacterium]|nr:BatD family protein [Muribaculaceae bacterium]